VHPTGNASLRKKKTAQAVNFCTIAKRAFTKKNARRSVRKMRDRLVELIVNAENAIYQETPYITDTERIGKVASHLLSEGVIVPPLWAGQTVYSYNHYLGGVFAYLIHNVCIGYLGKSGIYWAFEANCHDEETDELLDEIDFDLDYIGKTVFLTRAGAEKAIAERREE
jgi:hypothetical protein